MQNKREFKTEMLDVAAYLLLSGYDCSIEKRGVNDCVYTFTDAPATCERLAKTFMRGNAKANMIHYMYSREALKRRARVSPLISPDGAQLSQVAITAGMSYYYKDNKEIQHAIYAEKEPHLSRLRTGNFFTSKNEVK